MYSKLKRPLLATLGAFAAFGVAAATTASGLYGASVVLADDPTSFNYEKIESINDLQTGDLIIVGGEVSDDYYFLDGAVESNWGSTSNLAGKWASFEVTVSDDTFTAELLSGGVGTGTFLSVDSNKNFAYASPSESTILSLKSISGFSNVIVSSASETKGLCFGQQPNEKKVRDYAPSNQQKPCAIYKDVSEPMPELGVLDSITVSIESTKVDYFQGDFADWSGLVINAKDAAGVEATLNYASEGVSIDPAHGTLLNEAGDFSAKVSLTLGDITKTASFSYHVKEQAATIYTKATTDSFKNALLGSKVLLTYKNYANSTKNSAGYLNYASIASDTSSVDSFALYKDGSDAVPLTLALGYTADSFSLYYDDGSDSGYLALSGSNVIVGNRNNSGYATSASFNIAIGNDNEAVLTFESDDTYFLQFNASAKRFKPYQKKSNQQNPYLFLATPTAQEQVSELATYIMAWDTNNQCETNYYEAKNAYLNRLDEEAQIIFKETIGDASEEADLVAQAKARYDAWSINRGDYDTRFDDNVPSGAAIVKGNANDDMGIYVGAIAIVLAGLGVGSAVIIKKRKSRI